MSEVRRLNGIWDSVLNKEAKSKLKRSAVDTLKKISIFETLSNRDIQNIARLVYQRSYDEGEAIINEGDPAAGMYVIIEGEVKVTREMSNGTILQLAMLEGGEFFGDVGLLDCSPRTATVRASRDCKIIGFFRPELLYLMDSNPKLASKLIFKLSQVLAARLRFTHNILEKAQDDIDRLKLQLKKASPSSSESPAA